MYLSKRLQAVASLVAPGNRLADVGTDHGYVPLWLWEQGRIPSAIAMDVAEGPLSRAREHICMHHGESAIELRLSDGLKELALGECDTLVIAGMGGHLMKKILEDGQAKLSGIREMVLQPQSDISEVRRFLCISGWKIDHEEMIFEEGKYYSLFRAVPGVVDYDREIWFLYGKLLLERRHPVLWQYLTKERHTRIQIAGKLRKADTAGARLRLVEVERELELIEEAMEYWHPAALTATID